MKTKIQRPNRKIPAVIAMASVVAFLGGVFANAQETNAVKTADETKPVESVMAEPGEFNNWAEFSFGNFFVNGDKAQFQQRTGLPGGAFGGVEDFHYESPFQKKGTFSIDGRGIFDNHDYDLRLGLTHPDKGFVRFGYREFHTYYDGSGGFFPGGTNHWFSLYDDDFHVDRGEVWFEAGLRIPEKPELTFRYSHEFRDGKKDSTIWGDTVRLGLPGANNSRGIVPTFLAIDERRDSFALDAKHTISKTDFGLGLRYDRIDNDDSRNIHRRPGELTGSVTAAADRFVTQRDEFEEDLLNAHAFTETRFNDRVLFTTGYSYTRLDTDVSGSRIYGADYDPIYDPLFARRQQRDEGFLDLRGGSQVDQYVMNVNLMFTPWENIAIVPSLRVEHQDQDGAVTLKQTSFNAPPARAATSEDLRNTRERGFTDVSEQLELRYTGFTNWVLYARGEWLEGEGTLRERQADNDPDAEEPATAIIERDTDSDRFTQKYVTGVNWYPLRRMNMAAQYYYKIRENDYTHKVDLTTNAPPSGNRYPAFLTDHDFETHDLNFRVTVRPCINVTLVSRYDYQLSTIHTKADFLADIESAEMTTHILSESISWTPWARLYLQGSLSYVLDQLETPANNFVGSETNNIVPKSRNNYWNASALAGFALDDKTDLQTQYTYYRADNYRDNSEFSVPYGADAEEHSVTATLSRQLTKKLRASLKYGFFSNRDVTSGGHNSYAAHLVYSSLQYRF
jgi:hypothetical protein